ncbi:MAG: hypothetical protein ACQESP_12410 [Candidatus Muiribacteriota bacterium]
MGFEVIPKLTDVKLLREISKVVITPMLIAAVLNQSEFAIFGISVNSSAKESIQIIQFIAVFLITSLVVGLVAWSIHDLMLYFQIITNFIGLSILSTLFLAFGFLGVYGEIPTIIESLDKMWFYTSFVCGFYLLARIEDIERYFS